MDVCRVGVPTKLEEVWVSDLQDFDFGGFGQHMTTFLMEKRQWIPVIAKEHDTGITTVANPSQQRVLVDNL